MNKLIAVSILFLFFTVTGFPQNKVSNANIKTEQTTNESSNIKSEKADKETSNSNPNQDYINLLKEFNEQSNKKLENQFSNYSTIISILLGISGIFTAALLVAALFGWNGYREIKNQKEKIEEEISTLRTFVSKTQQDTETAKTSIDNHKDEIGQAAKDINETYIRITDIENNFKDSVRNNVRSLIDYAVANVFLRVEEPSLAHESFLQIDRAIENGDFGQDIKLLESKIEYKLGNCDKSIHCLNEFKTKIDNAAYKDQSKQIQHEFDYYDLMAANYKKLYRKKDKNKENLIIAKEFLDKAFNVLSEYQISNEYDEKRVLLNIQSIHLWNDEPEKVIEIYNNKLKPTVARKIKEKNLERLELGICITTIDACYQKQDETYISLLDSLKEALGGLDELEKQIKGNFNVKKEYVNKIINSYKQHLHEKKNVEYSEKSYESQDQ